MVEHPFSVPEVFRNVACFYVFMRVTTSLVVWILLGTSSADFERWVVLKFLDCSHPPWCKSGCNATDIGISVAGKLLPSLQLILGAVTTTVTFGTVCLTLAALRETASPGNLVAHYRSSWERLTVDPNLPNTLAVITLP
jgi:hypothetical protein